MYLTNVSSRLIIVVQPTKIRQEVQADMQEVILLNKISRIFTAGLLTIVLIRLSEFVPGFELASRADRLLFHMVMWLNLNELLKKSD